MEAGIRDVVMDMLGVKQKEKEETVEDTWRTKEEVSQHKKWKSGKIV